LTSPTAIDFQPLLDRICYRYPSPLVDAVTEHEPGRRLCAVKNVTVGEEFFQGHFPGAPLMPGVLMIETLVQAAALLVLHRDGGDSDRSVYLRRVDDAKFRRQVVPGDQMALEVTMRGCRSPFARVHGIAQVGSQVVAEADLLLVVVEDRTRIDPTAIVHRQAEIGEGTEIGPYATIGPNVKIGRGCRIGASAVIDGWTEIGDETRIFPFGSIGLIPQDLKFRGEMTRLTIGRRNVFREFVTINRGTKGGGGITQIGDRNVFMAYTHIAHDCRIGHDTIFVNGATLGGHVLIDDFAYIGAYSGIHQFCRVGRHAFVGGYSVATKDVLPFSRTVGNRARNYGLNTLGLMRRGFSGEVIVKLKSAFRYLLQSKLNTSHALTRIEADRSLACPEVEYLVEFIRRSQRGVVLRRGTRRVEEVAIEEEAR
jgi:UDP-N-acetylglucosamine acyltransferase